jgi:hypothetical protein
VLRTFGIDVILGMDWMKQNQAVIQCQQKVVVVNAPNGDKINVDVAVQKQPTALVNLLDDDDDVIKENSVIDEFPYVFLDDCQVCHLTETLNFLLNYYLKLHP